MDFSENVKKHGAEQFLDNVDGLLIPGGFGERGVEGKIESIKFVRTHGIPFFRDLPRHAMRVIEFARNVCGLEGAQSTEFHREAEHPVITLLSDSGGHQHGRTMPLGRLPLHPRPRPTFSHRAYGSLAISERHRHRYEFNNSYRGAVHSRRLTLAGRSPGMRPCEVIEIANHPWFVGVPVPSRSESPPHQPAHRSIGNFIAAAVRISANRARPTESSNDARPE